MTILDCTLRDGGYYTNWDFEAPVVEAYLSAMDKLPVKYIEIGYRNKPSSDYLGQFGYTPIATLETIRSKSQKKIAVMLNEKSVSASDLAVLLKPIVGLVDVVRLAVAPENFDRALALAKAVKALGFEVSFNLMYMSIWNSTDCLYEKLRALNGEVDVFCMVDSYGSLTPQGVRAIMSNVKESTSVSLGFHGHNNLQMALINSLTAIECGAENIDVTILGMGRGAGNLNLELLLTYLNGSSLLDVDFNAIGDAITVFEPLRAKYNWGTNLPYMLSGANSFPQKEVMEWVMNRRYSFNSIVRALSNRRNNMKDNARFPIFVPYRQYDSVVVVGGGTSAVVHAEAIQQYLLQRRNTAIVFATARHAAAYLNIPNDHYYCLLGDESRRLNHCVGNRAGEGVGILPPYPRKMGTEILASMEGKVFELEQTAEAQQFAESVTYLALRLSQVLTTGSIFLVGYDGYSGQVLSEKELALSQENQVIFSSFAAKKGAPLQSLTPTVYPELRVESIYQFI